MTQDQPQWPPPVWFLRPLLLERIAFAVSLVALATVAVTLPISGQPVGSYAGVLLCGVGVILAHTRPLPGLTVVVAAEVVSAAFAQESVGVWSVVVITLFSVALRSPRAIAGALLSGVVVYFSIVARQGSWDAAEALIAPSLCVAAAAAGAAVRAQYRYWEALRQRAVDALVTRDIDAERRVAEERVRIARDLHDTIGHEVAVISMSLGAAEVALERDPEHVREPLHAARAGIQRVLKETQQILDILRRGETVAGEPTVSVSQIPRLVDAFRDSGMRLQARIADIDESSIDPGVSVAAYRVVQEALTNARKYGNGAADLTMEMVGDSLRIEVENAVAASATQQPRSGYGLVGMRERIESVGGELAVTRTDRFLITATMSAKGSGR